MKNLIQGFSFFEKAFLTGAIFVIVALNLSLNNSKITLLSAVCGITYTFFAGKGRVFCYYIGIIGTLCYTYLSYKNGFFGNMCLYGLYYLPMEIIGIFSWKKHLKKNGYEIEKKTLQKKALTLYILFSLLFSIILCVT